MTVRSVAVLGGSNGAYAAAADLQLSGFRVHLWRRNAEALGAIHGQGGIEFVGEDRAGLARPTRVTADIGEALDGADVILVPLPATAQEDVARRCAPHLKPDQIVLFTPGTLGAYVFARELARAGGELPWALAETATLPYLARKVGPATVKAPVRAANLPVGVFPADRSAPTLERLRELYPSIRPTRDILDAALSNAGVVIHPPLVLLNTGPIEGDEQYDIHAAGTTRSVLTLIHRVDAERVAIRRALGYPPPHYEIATYYDESQAHEGLYGVGAKAKLVKSDLWRERLHLGHRYVAEDVGCGLALSVSLARALAVNVPVSEALLCLLSAMAGEDFATTGRTLRNLGLDRIPRGELREFFRLGWQAPVWDRVVRGG